MNQNQFLRWIEQIFSTREEEIDCERLKALLPVYIDFEIAHGGQTPTGDPFSLVVAHLAQCPDCAEEHEAILSIAKLLTKGTLPQPEKILSQFEEIAGEEEEVVA